METPSWLNKILNARSFSIDKPKDIRVEISGIAALTYYLVAAIFGTIVDFVPQLASLHPASIVSVIFGLMYGPVAALGVAVGYLLTVLGDEESLGFIFGTIGNFLLAYSAFVLWRIFTGGKFANFNFKYLATFWLVCLISSLISALVIVGGYSWLNLPVSFKVVFLNNFIWPAVLGLFFIKLIRKGLFDDFFNK